MITRCLECKKEIQISQSRFDRGNGKYCSNKCRTKHKAKSYVKLICAVCNKPFELRYRKRVDKVKCCSLKCAGKYKSKKEKVSCEYCNKRFNIVPSTRKKSKTGRFFCCIECYDAYRSNVQLSVNLKVHYNLQYKTKKEIFKRDNYICQCCGKKEHDLTADHITPVNYFVTRFKTVEECIKMGVNKKDNLQTLCFKCNRSKGIAVADISKVNGI